MSDEPRKKPGWAFWATIGLSLVVAYVLSFGPVLVSSRTGIGAGGVAVVYRPIVRLMENPNASERFVSPAWGSIEEAHTYAYLATE